jgi:hypothetical protein
MLDKALCVGGECPLKQDCERWDVNTPCTPDCLGQSYFIRPPFVGGTCEHYEHIFRRDKEKDDGC